MTKKRPASSTRFCYNCGVPLTAGSVFCPNCGMNLQTGQKNMSHELRERGKALLASAKAIDQLLKGERKMNRQLKKRLGK